MKMENTRSVRRDLLTISAFVLLARGLMLLNDGIYWDDWIIYKIDSRYVFNHFLQTGIPLKSVINVFLKDHPMVYHFLTFFSLWASAVLLYRS